MCSTRVMGGDPAHRHLTRLRLKLIADLASGHRLPAIAADNEFPQHGGLMYYGVNVNLMIQMRQAASYVDRILKGMKPGELPVQRADKYTLVINLKTAKVLGLENLANDRYGTNEKIRMTEVKQT
jgi:ABC-type uncharacterized transport system substrate-binding protein